MEQFSFKRIAKHPDPEKKIMALKKQLAREQLTIMKQIAAMMDMEHRNRSNLYKLQKLQLENNYLRKKLGILGKPSKQ